MYNYSRLLGKMKEKGFTQATLAKFIGISDTTLNSKLNNSSEFRQTEMRKILLALGESLDKIEYFFTTVLVKTQERKTDINEVINVLGNRIKKGCFAYSDDSDDGCKALKKLYCRNEVCKFYKPMCQYLKEKEKYDS